MKAVVCKEAELNVAEVADPAPGKGQLLLEVLRCGICGSDLHARHQADELADVAAEVGYDEAMRPAQDVVLGHEFCGLVVERGPGTGDSLADGTPVVALPIVRNGGAVHPIGLSARAPGGYAEQLVVEESLAFPVPNGLGPDVATLTEPLAVAWHAVRRSEVKKRNVAVVIGCGPIGLGVILMLKAKGVRHVVASDFSAGRRALAQRCGADLVVDPGERSPYAGDHGHLTSAPEAFDLAMTTIERLQRLPLPWWQVWSAAETARGRPEEPGRLRVCRRARRHRRDRRERPTVLTRCRRRRLHGSRPDSPGARHQQGDRPALRPRLHPA